MYCASEPEDAWEVLKHWGDTQTWAQERPIFLKQRSVQSIRHDNTSVICQRHQWQSPRGCSNSHRLRSRASVMRTIENMDTPSLDR
jgi:hypothetical protein